jgi:hypothetical protein
VPPRRQSSWTDIDGESVNGLGGMNRSNAWSCPQGRPGWSGFPGWGSGAPTGTSAAGGNYTLNAYLYQFEPIDTGVAGTSTPYSLIWDIAYHTGLKHERKARYPSTTLASLDGYVNYNNFSGGTYTIQAYAPAWTTAYDDNIAYRSNRLYPYHNRAQNHLFLDGHAKALPLDRFLAGDTAWNSEYLRMAKGLRGSGL